MKVTHKVHLYTVKDLDNLFKEFLALPRHRHRNRILLKEQFSTAIGRLQALGFVRMFSFGGLVLLQPEMLDSYASSIIFAAKDEPDGMGSIAEDVVRRCEFSIPMGERIEDREKEQLLVVATVEDLVSHEIAIREPASSAQMLIFPSQLTRENPDLPDPPGKSTIYQFEGAPLNIYATAVVRLSHSGIFKKDEMWKNAATFRSAFGSKCGVFLLEDGEGQGRITTFFDPGCGVEVRTAFESFLDSHIEKRASPGSLRRTPVFACKDCQTPVSDVVLAKRRERGFDFVDCGVCGSRISIIDKAELPAPVATTAAIERQAAAHRRYDTGLLSASGEMLSSGFRKWAGSDAATVALAFTDVVDSTKLGVRLGDEQMSALRDKHFTKGQGFVGKYNGYLIKTIGDSLMAAFRTAEDALNFAIEFTMSPGANGFEIRAGIHVGPVEIKHNDAFGTMVNYAARVQAQALGPEIWVSDRAHADIVQRGAVAHANLKWEEYRRELKGIPGPQTLWRLPQTAF